MTDEIEPKIVAVEAENANFPRSCDPPADDGVGSSTTIEQDPSKRIEKSVSPDALLVTVKDVQRILSIGRTKAFELMAQGKLERHRVDGCVRITMKSIMAFVEGK